VRFCKFHGNGKENDPRSLLDFDIVLTTYSTLVIDFSKGFGVLHRVQWFRVVLDEGMSFPGEFTNSVLD
jgi:SWI/SNF-related matrix-associated actin-dependent regulator of chromatin subfamily A3